MNNQSRFPTILSASPAACLIASSLIIAGCGTTTRGAVKADAPVTSNTSASYIAALDGGVIGRQTGLSISKADRQRALEAEYRALEAARGGQPVVWQGSGISGSVVAAAPYQVGSQNCRQYSHTVTVKGQESAARGAACRNGDGTWTPLG
jgi:surface antigen